MPRKSKETPKALTIGFFGDGEMSTKAFDKAMNEFTEEYTDGVTCILPVTKELFTDNMKGVAEWCAQWDDDANVTFIAVHDEAAEKVRALKPFIADAAKAHKIGNVGSKIVTLLKAVDQAEEDVVFAGFYVNTEDQVDEDAELEALAEKASDAGVEVRCVNNDFDVVEFDGDDEPAEDADSDEPAEEEEAASTVDESEAQDDDEPYTEENLAEYSLDELKSILTEDFGRPRPEGRVRGTTVIKLILAAQEEDDAKGETTAAAVADDEENGSSDPTVIAEEIIGKVAEAVAIAVADANAEAFREVLDNIAARLETIENMIQAQPGTPAPLDVEETEAAPAAPSSGGRRRRRPASK